LPEGQGPRSVQLAFTKGRCLPLVRNMHSVHLVRFGGGLGPGTTPIAFPNPKEFRTYVRLAIGVIKLLTVLFSLLKIKK